MAKLLLLFTSLVIFCALTKKIDSTPIRKLGEMDFDVYPKPLRNNTSSDSIPKSASIQEYVDKSYQLYKAILEQYRIKNLK